MVSRSALLTAALFSCAVLASAQTRYASGQNVVPVFEGWERNPDGTINMVFGYMNRNYEEQIDIPVGPNNKVEVPGQAGKLDQGQPAHFYRRRQQFVFKVKVPKDFDSKADVVWSLTMNGKTEKAYGHTLDSSEIATLVYQENRGGPGEMTYPEEPNAAPTIEMVGTAVRSVKANQPLELTVLVTDDGHPKPRVRRPDVPRRDSDGAIIAPAPSAAPTGLPARENPITQAVVKLDPGVTLGVTWVLYRSADGATTDDVAFDPMRVKVVDGKATTKVTFSKKGSYRLRAYADDGVLLTPLDVTVNVQE